MVEVQEQLQHANNRTEYLEARLASVADCARKSISLLTCPAAHVLKGIAADVIHECDVCLVDIPKGTRVLDCAECDFSLCHWCAERELEQRQRVKQKKTNREGGRVEPSCSKNRALRKTVTFFPVRDGDDSVDDFDVELEKLTQYEFERGGHAAVEAMWEY